MAVAIEETVKMKKTEKKFEIPFVRASATEVRQNFSKYMEIAAGGKDVVVEKSGKEVVRIISSKKKPTFLDFEGILEGTPRMTREQIREERYQRYEATGRY